MKLPEGQFVIKVQRDQQLVARPAFSGCHVARVPGLGSEESEKHAADVARSLAMHLTLLQNICADTIQLMRFSREEIQQMDEASLRLQVLKPLFERMGFQDVFHHHGGTGEKGKDFVMWKAGELGERVNYAVVAKVERTSGKADMGAHSAGGVTFQIQQAFGASFRDPLTGEDQRVSECWVVSSEEITKESKDSILLVLQNSNLDRLVKFVDGDRLWKLIQDHFPVSVAMDNVHQAQRILDNLDENWRVAVSTQGGKVDFIPEPKHQDKPIEPLVTKVKFQCPDNDAGNTKLEEIRSAIEKGTPLVLEAPHLVGVEFPSFMQSLIGEVGKVEWKPSPPSKSVEMLLRIESDNGTRLELDSILFDVERAGTKEVLLSNRGQNHPWIFEIVLQSPQDPATLKFGINFEGLNVHRLLQACRLTNSLGQPGLVSLELADTGFVLMKVRTEPMMPQLAGVPESLLSLLEALDFIQRTTHVELKLPNRELEGKEVQQVYFVAKWLSGRFSTTGVALSSSFNRTNVQSILSGAEANLGAPFTTQNSNCVEKIFGQPVPLGHVVIHLSKARITQACFDRLREEIKDPMKSIFGISFESVDDSPAEFFCLNTFASLNDLPAHVREVVGDKALQQFSENRTV